MSTSPEIATFIQGIDIFSSLDRSDIEQIASQFIVEKIPAGYPVTEKALPAVCMYLVLNGVIEVVERNEEGAETIIGEFKAGEYFNEISLLTGEPCEQDTRTGCNSVVLVLYKKRFDQMLQKHPSLSRHFLKVLSTKLQLIGGEIERAKSKEVIFNRFLRRELEFQHSEFIAGCKQMQEVMRQVERAAGNGTPTLIVGQRGVGKELAARTIHHRSARGAKPFIWVNCGLVEKQNWGVEIFGLEETGNWRIGFLEMASGGTLLLTHIEKLPSAIQCALAEFCKTGDFERPGSRVIVKADVRIVATSEMPLQELRTHYLHPTLLAAFEHGVTVIPPLSERKKDFPALVEHLIEKLSRRGNVSIAGVSGGAMELLLSYDYPGNVDELENILERAAVLAGGGPLLREHVVFGVPRSGVRNHFNLLHLHGILKFLRSKLYPFAFQWILAICLTLIVVACFLKSESLLPDVATLSVWSIWWPALIVLTFFAARWWCGVCPISLLSVAGSYVGKSSNYGADFFKRNGLYLMAAGMILIFWFEEVFHMSQSPTGTGILISSIGGGALLSGLLIGRYTWCSWVCPLGGTLGMFSKASIVELRSNANICTNQCKTHTCYKGNGYDGCPMQLHPLSLDTNQKCKMCFNCLKNCPHRSIRLDLRPAGEELWSGEQSEKGAALFSLALLGVLLPMVINRHGEIQTNFAQYFPGTPWKFPVLYAVALALGVGIACGLFGLAVRWSRGRKDKPRGNPSWAKYAQGLIPVALAGHVSYRLSQLPLSEKLTLQVGFQAGGKSAPHIISSINLFPLVLVLILLAGFVSTFYVFWRMHKVKKENGDSNKFLASVGGYVILGLFFSAVYFLLFFM